MLRCLVLLGLLSFAPVGRARPQAPRDGSKQHDNAQEKQKTADAPKPVVAINSQHGANNQEQASDKSPKYQWGELLAPANVPNWFLVIVGGVTGWFVYKTLRAIKKQADIMEAQAKDARESGAEAAKIALATAQAAQKSADAALLNIQAFISSERPWISVQVEPSERKHGYRIVATNKGRTPAAMISHAENHILIDIMELPPDVAVYGKPDDRPRMILPDGSIVLQEISEYSFVGKDEEKIAKFRNLHAEGYVFGVITYRDLLGSSADKPHETRWAFHVLTWQGGDVLVSDYTVGGDEYTVHT